MRLITDNVFKWDEDTEEAVDRAKMFNSTEEFYNMVTKNNLFLKQTKRICE